MKALVVNRDCVRHNVRCVKERAGGRPIYGVLKADAYGMGLPEIASILSQEGITRFAVTEPNDAVRLRNAGHTQQEILLLRSTSRREEIDLCLDHNVTLTIGSQDAALAVNGIAEQRRTVAEAQIEIDIGMGRYGFLPSEIDKIINLYQYMNNVAITGLYAHFPSAFGNPKITKAQKQTFDDLLEKLRAEGIDTGLVHAANSSALFFQEDCRYDAVRVGSAFTGRLPRRCKDLKPATRAQCPICEIRWLPKGMTVGYAGVYKTKRPTKIAVLAIGSADGFCIGKERDSWRLRDTFGYLLSDLKRGLTRRRVFVRINGVPARVLGHVGTGHTVVDITEVSALPGQMTELDVNPIYAARLPRVYES